MPSPKSNETNGLQEEYNNARERLNQQSTIFEQFAKEGQRMLRITFIYTGLLVTSGSIILSSEISISYSGSDFVSFLFILSGVCLVGSLLLHTIGREVRGVKTIFEPDEYNENLQSNFSSTEDYYKDKISQYTRRIEYNEDVLDVFETNLGFAKGLLSGSIFATVFGVAIEFLDKIDIAIGSIGLLLVLIYIFHQFSKFPEAYYEREF